MPSEMLMVVAAVLLLRGVRGSEGKTVTTALALALATFALGFLGFLVRRTVASVSRIGMSILKQLDLLAGLHRRISPNLTKEASIRRLRYLHLSSFLGDHDEVGQCACRSTRAAWRGNLEGLLALLRQLLGRESISRCSEAIEGSVKKHLKYWGKVSVHLH